MKEPARATPEFFEYAKYNIIEKLPSMLDENVVRESGLFIWYRDNPFPCQVMRKELDILGIERRLYNI